jgi:transposase
MSGKRYPEEFKIEAVKQITEYGHSIPDVAKRLGITPKSLYDWKAQYGDRSGRRPPSSVALGFRVRGSL